MTEQPSGAIQKSHLHDRTAVRKNTKISPLHDGTAVWCNTKISPLHDRTAIRSNTKIGLFGLAYPRGHSDTIWLHPCAP